tara:strand:+ start:36 stop:353 length:318 start_codon:yes stop_codon:yes gene_type:complete
MEAIQKHKIRLNKTQEGIRRTDGSISSSYDKDFYITISIVEDIAINEYIDIEVDPLRTEIKRQFFNPYFIELGFFRDINHVTPQSEDVEDSVEVKAKKYDIKINK